MNNAMLIHSVVSNYCDPMDCRHIGQSKRKCETWNFGFLFPGCHGQLCVPSTDELALSTGRRGSSLQASCPEIFLGSITKAWWWSIQLISGSNLSRGAADTAWPKPASWITSFLWPKVFTLNHTVYILIRLAKDPHINNNAFLSVNLLYV